MEFDELQKIWNQQNNQTMYVINEEALHRRIRAKRDHARLITNINDFGLIGVAIITGSILLMLGSGGFFSYLSAIAMYLIGIYVFLTRLRRLKMQPDYEHSMLGDLEQAIAGIDTEIKRARTIVWWFMLPALLPALLNIAQSDAPWWKWLLIPLALGLSLPLIRWELRRKHLPRKRRLEALRKTLMEHPQNQATITEL